MRIQVLWKERKQRNTSRKKSKACIVNRFLWEITEKYNYKHVIENFKFIMNNRYHIYNFCLPQKMLYPLAVFYINNYYPSL